MKFEPKYYRTHPVSKLLLVESVFDKCGNLFYSVSYGENLSHHVFFKNMTSMLDFLDSNFKNV